MRQLFWLPLLLVLMLVLMACGGGGSGDEPEVEHSSSLAHAPDVERHTAVFAGSVISGVRYRALLDETHHTGVTGVDGTFFYFSRDDRFSSVIFSVGDLRLGTWHPLSATAQTVTVFDLVDASAADAAVKAVNIYRLLRSLDGTEEGDVVAITSGVRGALSGVGAHDLATLVPARFDGRLAGFIERLSLSNLLRDGVTNLLTRQDVERALLTTKRRLDAAKVRTVTLASDRESVAADGSSRVALRASVVGVDGAAVSGVWVPFQTTAGTLHATEDVGEEAGEEAGARAVRLTDAMGRASVALIAPLQPIDATVSATAGGWSAVVTVAFSEAMPVTMDGYAEGEVGAAASIRVGVGEGRLFVQGVGQQEQMPVTLMVQDAGGGPLNETAAGYSPSSSNLRVSLQAHPGGGERLSGLRRTADAVGGLDVETVTDDRSILVRTTAGEAEVTLRSGRLPGVVQLKAELLDPEEGSTVLATAVSAPLVIASGPPHSLVFTRASNDTPLDMTPLGLAGVYCQRGTVLVTDRYGNAVPDDTALALGLVDTVLHEGTAALTQGSRLLTLVAPRAGFDPSWASSVVEVGGVNRAIQVGDRLLIPTDLASTTDRSRFVQTVGSASQLGVDAPYLSAEGDPEQQEVPYIIGTALRGGAIHGYSTEEGSQGCVPAHLTPGITRTVRGLAPVRVTYPANGMTILSGCFEDVTLDTRHTTPRSSQVWAMATAGGVGGGTLTTLDGEGFCFHAATPSRLTADREVVRESTALMVTLQDANGIRLPFVDVACSAAIVQNVSTTLSVEITPARGVKTDGQGQASFMVTVAGGGGAEADLATITCAARDARLAVRVQVP